MTASVQHSDDALVLSTCPALDCRVPRSLRGATDASITQRLHIAPEAPRKRSQFLAETDVGIPQHRCEAFEVRFDHLTQDVCAV